MYHLPFLIIIIGFGFMISGCISDSDIILTTGNILSAIGMFLAIRRKHPRDSITDRRRASVMLSMVIILTILFLINVENSMSSYSFMSYIFIFGFGLLKDAFPPKKEDENKERI